MIVHCVLLYGEIFLHPFMIFQKTPTGFNLLTKNKMATKKNNITSQNYFKSCFRNSKLVGCTTSVFLIAYSIHAAYSEASILLKIWNRGENIQRIEDEMQGKVHSILKEIFQTERNPTKRSSGNSERRDRIKSQM